MSIMNKLLLFLKNAKRIALTACVFLMLCSFSQAQHVLRGLVLDASSEEALSGASITVPGQPGLTVKTNEDGQFTLSSTKPVATLHVNFIGYVSQEVAIENKNDVIVYLQVEEQQLDEVVVVGYGTQSKRSVTGAISSVDMESRRNMPDVSVGQALRGTLAGVQYTDNGRPGQGGDILIRGKRSLSASNNPLIVVDGAIYAGNLNDLNPNDVASMEVLKDASAVAIYGSRAANGVILITTRVGKESKPIISLSTNYGISDFSYKPRLLTGARYLEYMVDYQREMGEDATMDNVLDYIPENVGINYQNNKEFDPWEAASQDAYTFSSDVSLSGRNENVHYYLSAGVSDAQGLVFNDRQKKHSIRTNINTKITDWLSVGINANYIKRNVSGTVASVENITKSVPYGDWFFDDGLVRKVTVDGENVAVNPLYYSLLTTNEHLNNNLFATGMIELKAPFLEGLSYKFSYTPSVRWSSNNDFRINDVHEPGQISFARKISEQRFDGLNEHLLKYNTTFNNTHFLDVTLLYSTDSYKADGTTAMANRLASEALGWNDLTLGELQTTSSSASDGKGVSSMARINYGLKQKYYATFTVRRDGSSVFSANHKFATFPSAAVSWVASEESFFGNVEALDLLKLRVSYGAVGNQGISPYQSLELLNAVNYVFGEPGQTYYGVFPGRMANNELKWETTYTTNIGVDFAFFRNRISGALELYNMDTKDLLVNRSIPVMTGYATVWDNLGEVNNKGIELTLNTTPIRKSDFTWDANVTFSTNKNRIVHLYRSDLDGDGIEDNDLSNQWFIGKPIDVYYDFVFNGIYQVGDDIPEGFKAGDVILEDLDNNGAIDADDRKVVGNSTTPNVRWSLMNRFAYKNFNLSFLLNAMQGWMGSYNREMSPGRSLNFVDRGWWTPVNASQSAPSINYQNRYGHRYYESRDFLRIQDVTLGYSFDEKLLSRYRIRGIEVFVSGKNLYTFTDWTGADPESGEGSVANYYPFSRIFSAGARLSF